MNWDQYNMLPQAHYWKLREMMDDIRTYHVMSALRGPDNASEVHIKRATTAVIRWKIVGGINGYGDYLVSEDSEEARDLRLKLFIPPGMKIPVSPPPVKPFFPESSPADTVIMEFRTTNPMEINRVGGHFIQHAVQAFRALGLEWHEVNKL